MAVWCVLAAVAGLILAAPAPGRSERLTIAHDLRVELILDEGRLVGHDRLRIPASQRGALVFQLSPRAENLRVQVNGLPRRFSRRAATFQVALTDEERGRPLDVDLAYEAVFDHPFPVNPYNTDNPGFGVAGTISGAGVFLLDGARWYPDLVDSRPTFALEVKAPAGILAVTAGRGLGHRTSGGASISRWQIDHPVRGLALSAAAYQVAERRLGDVVVATYFRHRNQDLSSAYLAAASGYLEFYQERFGPYPFPKFAVVENFFPTGYGFASYTLIGERVLRLPFILTTSLGHEIAHCWWGNGVWVDFAGGNWSEGLTTYVADYLYQERDSADAACLARQQMLRHYTTLAPPENDFPLSRFVGRRDPATKAVGYDKGAMVFHMLRRAVGEAHFWGALRDLFASHCFRSASWEDIRRAMARRSGRSLDWFFEQWVRQQGAPRLALEQVRMRPESGAWQVAGRLRQQPPFFRASWDLVLETAAGTVVQPIEVTGATTDFNIIARRKPTALVVDPEAHVLRRLDPAEIPPAVNALKASSAVTVVVCDSGAPNPRRLADILVRSLGIGPRVTVAAEAAVDPRKIAAQDLILVGLPRDPSWLPPLPAGAVLAPDRFVIAGNAFGERADTFFGVFRRAGDGGRVTAVLLSLGPEGAEAAAAKITHYGRFSYLAFRNGVNQEKGIWPVDASPVVVRWNDCGS
jgi:hypothetical protein